MMDTVFLGRLICEAAERKEIQMPPLLSNGHHSLCTPPPPVPLPLPLSDTPVGLGLETERWAGRWAGSLTCWLSLRKQEKKANEKVADPQSPQELLW